MEDNIVTDIVLLRDFMTTGSFVPGAQRIGPLVTSPESATELLKN